MADGIESGLAAWEAAIDAMDVKALNACLDPEVTFKSPVVHRPYVGATMTGAILHAVTEVFEGFRYTHRIVDGSLVGLVFTARVGDREIEGWDFLTFSEAGLVTNLTVMVRPLSGLTVLAEAMKAKLEDLGYL